MALDLVGGMYLLRTHKLTLIGLQLNGLHLTILCSKRMY